MATIENPGRGTWNSKLGFILAAAGSAVGLGNIWGFPTQVADNGGAAFILVYLVCCILVGLPVMIAEITIGRKTGKNPVGAFKALDSSGFGAIIGYWGVLCGMMILAFYLVISGWTVAYVFEEILKYTGNVSGAAWFGDLANGPKNAIFTIVFMLFTVGIINGGVSNGIERATKVLMPFLLFILLVMIGYVFTLEGSALGVREYLMPDFSLLSVDLTLSAMGQAFFSLSLGMGALITYGSYLKKNQNIMESAAYVTVFDIFIAFVAGMLVIPAMYVALTQGIPIFGEDGELISSVSLVFTVLPQLFENLGGFLGLFVSISFFLLLGLAALTSSISLLEVPVSYVIDEHKIPRKKASLIIGGIVLFFALIISFDIGLIDVFVNIFNEIGLPLGGMMTCIFLGWVWKSSNALLEIDQGFPGASNSGVGRLWAFFIQYICPVLIGIVFVTTVLNIIR
ncbi:MAG: sodium-dependent transporter [Balneolia bacterium]|nr:sodium-dependent transporter [Balneolia bacterium]